MRCSEKRSETQEDEAMQRRRIWRKSGTKNRDMYLICVLLSLGMFRETIKPWGWSGIVSGIAGIVILAVWK
jgi:multidrug transporter EmrE-like cation transporter